MSRSEKAFCKDPLVRSLCSYKIRLDAYPKGKADGGRAGQRPEPGQSGI